MARWGVDKRVFFDAFSGPQTHLQTVITRGPRRDPKTDKVCPICERVCTMGLTKRLRLAWFCTTPVCKMFDKAVWAVYF